MHKRTFLRSLVALSAIGSLGLLTACGESAPSSVKVGVTAGPHAAIVTAAADVAAKRGLKVEVVEFTDYVTPNTALNDGALDLAVYQHEPFLNNFNERQKTKLVNVADAVVQPMGFYSNKVHDLKDVQPGSLFAIPNDPTNSGRALLLLQASGLITLKDGKGADATLDDIVKNPKNIKIRELEAAQLPRSLDDATVAVIPMNYVISAGLSPEKQGFYFESLDAPFALIVIAARENNQTDAKVKAFIEAYRSPEVKAFVEKTFNGTIKTSW